MRQDFRPRRSCIPWHTRLYLAASVFADTALTRLGSHTFILLIPLLLFLLAHIMHLFNVECKNPTGRIHISTCLSSDTLSHSRPESWCSLCYAYQEHLGHTRALALSLSPSLSTRTRSAGDGQAVIFLALVCRNMCICHGSISYLSGLVQPRNNSKIRNKRK